MTTQSAGDRLNVRAVLAGDGRRVHLTVNAEGTFLTASEARVLAHELAVAADLLSSDPG